MRHPKTQYLAHKLPSANSAPLNAGSHIAALRISTAGAGVGVLKRLVPLLEKHPVYTLQLEWDGDGDLPQLLRKLQPLGFVSARHRGPICSARWARSQQVVLNLPRDNSYVYASNVDVAEMLHSCHLVGDAFAEMDAKLLNTSKVEVVVLRRSRLFSQ